MEESQSICSNQPLCYTNCREWYECLETNDNINKPSNCCTILCCPIKFPLNLLFFGPCTIYNILRNKCHNTNKKNYLC